MTSLIVAGSRDFCRFDVVCSALSSLPFPISEIVSGGARGADRMGERYARRLSIPLRIFVADWGEHGKRAGFLRNAQMAAYASEKKGALFAFWDGESRGTKNMIEEATRRELRVFVCDISKTGFPVTEQKQRDALGGER